MCNSSHVIGFPYREVYGGTGTAITDAIQTGKLFRQSVSLEELASWSEAVTFEYEKQLNEAVQEISIPRLKWAEGMKDFSQNTTCILSRFYRI